MAVKVDIWNMAVSHCGSQKTISDDSEVSAERRICSRFWKVSYESSFRDFDLPFARKVIALSLVASNPTSEWLYSYDYPNDCLKVRKILSGNLQDSEKSRAVYELSQNSSGGKMLIYTNETSPYIKYTSRSALVSLWPEDYQLAISFRLGALIAPSLTSGNTQLAKDLYALYTKHIAMAAANAMNEEYKGSGPVSTFEESRT